MKANRKELLSQLSRLKPAIASGGQLVELSYLWFQPKTICAYNGGLGIIAPLASGFEGGVPGSTLMSLLQAGGSEEVTLAPAKSGIKVSMGRSNSTLALSDPDRCPWAFPGELPVKTSKLELSEGMLDALRRALAIRARSPSRVEHHGVMITPEEDGYTFYSTDGRNLIEVYCEGPRSKIAQCVLPRAFVEQIVGLCEPGSVLYATDAFLVAECAGEASAGLRIYSNSLDNEDLIDFNALIERYIGPEQPRRALPKGLGEAAARALILAGDGSARLTLTVNKKQMTVTGVYDAGKIEETLTLEDQGDDAEITIHVGSLQIGLAEAEQFYIADNALALFGDKDYLFLTSSASNTKQA